MLETREFNKNNIFNKRRILKQYAMKDLYRPKKKFDEMWSPQRSMKFRSSLAWY